MYLELINPYSNWSHLLVLKEAGRVVQPPMYQALDSISGTPKSFHEKRQHLGQWVNCLGPQDLCKKHGGVHLEPQTGYWGERVIVRDCLPSSLVETGKFWIQWEILPQKTLWRVLERDTRLPSSVSHDSNQNSRERLPNDAKHTEGKAEKERGDKGEGRFHLTECQHFGNVFSKLCHRPSPRLALIGTDKGIRESKSGRL